MAENAVGRLKQTSALNPCLWLCGIMIPGCLVAAHYAVGAIQVAVIVLTFLPVVLFGFGFIYLLVKAPDKLRSEDFEIRKQALELIEEKGGSISILGTSVEAIANPDRSPSRHGKDDVTDE
ncbi:MAG: hypothetical protein RLZZ15_3369 [Verrucomicrobiota bacterium]|jgi:hypothetical protein